MAIREVIQAGHPSLKTKNQPIASFSSTELKQLIQDLKDTMIDTGLIGIAAPQIAQNYSVFITHARNTKSRNLGKEDELRIYINPKLTFLSEEKSIIYEGCGSISEGTLFGPVERPKEIEVKAFNEKGEKFSIRCNGILARVILHEYDHLQGNEFIQKLSDYNKILSQEFYAKDIRNSSMQKQASKITLIEYKKLT